MFSFIIIGIQSLGQFWAGTRAQWGDRYGSGTLHPGQVLRGSLPLLSPTFILDVSTFHHQVPPRPPWCERSQWRKWELWVRMLSGNFAEMMTSTPFRDLLHAANLQGTDGFTSPPKEGVLGIFLPLKIRRLRPGLNPRTWVLKASTLPLNHRSCLTYHTKTKTAFLLKKTKINAKYPLQ